MQETHCASKEDVNLWSKEWQGKSYWSNGTSNSRGVACLVKHNLDLNIVHTDKDPNGRFISVNVKVDDQMFTFISIYAPNKGHERKVFFNNLNEKLKYISQSNPETEIILGGDFNCALQPQLDRRNIKGDDTKTQDIGQLELESIIKNHDLEDIWRRRHPKQKKYSFYKKHSKCASRIDFWLVSISIESQITKVNIDNAPKADHEAITMTLNTSKCERGPGFWKMNVDALNSDLFDQTFKTFWKGWKKQINNFESKRKWWELTKIKIKELSIEVAKQISKERNIILSQLEKTLKYEKSINPPNHEKINELTKQYNDIWQSKCNGARVRARVKHFEEGEKSTKFFFNQEKIRSRTKLWSQVRGEDGKIKLGIDNILEEQHKFYSKLMQSEGWDREAAEKLLKNVDVKVSDNLADMCEQNISNQELNKAIKALKIGKSPGFDGIPSEFYKKYWNQIKNCFYEVIKEIELTEELCISMYRGVICLLFKQGDRDEIGNWRPITLLNTDYKIIAIIYANRLKTVLPQIIGDDQKAYIEGRQITENVRLTQDLIELSNNNNTPGAIIFLDQKKAYDRVEWGYLEMCLKHFGFGPKFIKWTLMLYKSGQSCVLTNGFLSSFFSISRSMRQGCPIASYLYILQAEPMAESIRKNSKIKGLHIPTHNQPDKIEAKISMFADDTQLFHSTEQSIIEGFKTLDTYCKASGAQLNMHKTKGLYIGQWKNKQPILKKIKWVENVTGLGTVFGYNINYEEIWLKKFAKFKIKIQKWKHRDLTLEGKKLLINSYIMSSLSYLVDIYTCHIPEKFLCDTKTLIRDFLWPGKTWRIAQNSLALRKIHGGLELQDLDNFIKCKKVKWVIRIHFNNASRWNAYGKYCLHILDNKFGVKNFLLQCSNTKGLHLQNTLSRFYCECIDAWCKLKAKNKIENSEDILEQNIFGNVHIISKQKQSIFFENWTKSSFYQLKDIWNQETNTWKQANEIYDQLNIKRNWIAEFAKIKSCIPAKWKNVLKGDLDMQNNELLINNTVFRITPDKIEKNNCEIKLKNLKQKEIYFAYLYPQPVPTCVGYWNRIFQKNVEIENLFRECKNLLCNKKVLDFHWKILHHSIYSEVRLKKMNKSNGKCKLCIEKDETLCHLFYECKYVKPVWQQLQTQVLNFFESDIILNAECVILGITSNHIETSSIRTLYNFIIFNSIWCIWKHRNSIKYDAKQVNSANEMLITIAKLCKEQADLLLNHKTAMLKLEHKVNLNNLLERFDTVL